MYLLMEALLLGGVLLIGMWYLQLTCSPLGDLNEISGK